MAESLCGCAFLVRGWQSCASCLLWLIGMSDGQVVIQTVVRLQLPLLIIRVSSQVLNYSAEDTFWFHAPYRSWWYLSVTHERMENGAVTDILINSFTSALCHPALSFTSHCVSGGGDSAGLSKIGLSRHDGSGKWPKL